MPKPLGLAFLIEQFNLQVPSPHVRCEAATGRLHTRLEDHRVAIQFPAARYDYESPVAHLKFALRYEPVDLGVYAKLLPVFPRKELSKWIRSEPTGRFSRRAWYLYEFLTGGLLDVSDADAGAYDLLLDPKVHFTGAPLRSPRHRIVNNLLGTADFCPLVRKTDRLMSFQRKGLKDQAAAILRGIPPELCARAVNYLFTKETKSSFELERETPSMDRATRFIAALKEVENLDPRSKADLIRLQNLIVDPRYRASDYRDFHVYVGETQLDYQQFVHYVCPPHEHLSSLISGWMAMYDSIRPVDPVVAAAVASFGFVFIHPFEDGNGRIHRFLIHHMLRERKFVPEGMIFPVSAVMLRRIADYDRALETHSKSVMLHVAFQLNDKQEMTHVSADPNLYRYFDATPLAEFLYECIEATVEEDLPRELKFLYRFDEIRQRIQAIVDIPDRKLNLLVQLLWQNGGRLAKRKRDQFAELTDDEIAQMEAIAMDVLSGD